MTSVKNSSPPEEVQVTVKLPKPLHAKIVQIAAAEGKPLPLQVVQAVREYAATFERTSKTVSTFSRKKK